MAITYGNQTTYTDTAAGTSFSFSHSTSGVERLLVLIVSYIRTAETTPTITATYNGVSMTSAVSAYDTSTSRGYKTEVFYLVAPATGSNTVAITIGASVSGMVACAMTFTDVNQSSPIGVTGSGIASTGTSVSFNLSTTAVNSYIVGGGMSRRGTGNLTIDGAYTGVYDTESGTDTTTDLLAVGGYRATTSTGSYAFAFTNSASNYLNGAAIEIKPGSGGGATAAAIRKIRSANRIGARAGF